MTSAVALGAVEQMKLLGTREHPSRNGIRQRIFMDVTSLKRTGERVTVQFLFDNGRPDQLDVVSKFEKYIIDCRGRTLYNNGSSSFSNHMGTGAKVSESHGLTEQDHPTLGKPRPVVPGSFGAILFEATCADQQGSSSSAVKGDKADSLKRQEPSSMKVDLGSSSSGPSQDSVGQLVRNTVAAKAGGLIRVVEFKKVDGLASNMAGIAFYEMDWVANLEVLEDCWFKSETFEASPPNSNAEILFATQRFKKYKKGQRIELSGKTSFRKMESGWKAV